MKDDTPKPAWWRLFDRDYWMMRSALGYPVPIRVERLFPKSLGHRNAFRCGLCEARKLYPGLHIAHDIRNAHDNNPPSVWEDARHRIRIALKEVGLHD